MRIHRVSIIPVLLLLVLGAAGVHAADAEKKDQAESKPIAAKSEENSLSAIARAAEQRKAESEAVVFTNDDLERVWAGSNEAKLERNGLQQKPTAPKPTPPAKPNDDPLERLTTEREQREAQGQARSEAQADFDRASARVKAIEARLQKLRNPLLGRAEAPEKSEVDWSELDAAQRVKHSEQELADAREELESARKALAAQPRRR